MPRPPHIPLRIWIYRTHLLAGLITGIFALVLGLSGSILLFRADLERLTYPQLQSSAPFSPTTSLNDIYAQFQRNHPGERARSIVLPRPASHDPIQILAAGENNSTNRIYFDSATGRELGQRPPSDRIAWLVRLHHNLFARGHFFTGLVGAALTYLCVTGVVVWWPGLKHLRLTAAFAPHRLKAMRARDLHIAIGVWTVIALAVLAFTGMVFTWREQYTRAALALTGSSYQPKRVHSAGSTRQISLDAALARARDEVPGAAPTMLRFPAKPGDPLLVRLRADSDMPRMGAHQVFIGENAQVLAVERPGDKPLGARFVDALGPIHFADVGGLPLKLLWAVVGFAPAILFFSGLRLWWRKFARPAFASIRNPQRTTTIDLPAPNSPAQD